MVVELTLSLRQKFQQQLVIHKKKNTNRWILQNSKGHTAKTTTMKGKIRETEKSRYYRHFERARAGICMKPKWKCELFWIPHPDHI